jgi:putative transcriptional regulator
MGTLEGRLLIASPFLSDPNFFRSVVFIVRHNDEGAFGLVLNRPGTMRLEAVLEEARGQQSKRCDAIYLGGPVEGPLLALHRHPDLGEWVATCRSKPGTSSASSGWPPDAAGEWKFPGAPPRPPASEGPGDSGNSEEMDQGNAAAGAFNGDATAGDEVCWITSEEEHLMLLADRPEITARFFAHYSGWGPEQLEHEMEAGGWLVGDASLERIFSDPAELWERMVRRAGREILGPLVPGDEGFDPQVN